MQKLAMAVIDAKGAPMTGVTVTVKDAGTANNASIFSDNGSTAKANPFLNDANGSYEFYAANGRYDIQLVKTGVTFVAADTSDIALYDPADAAAAFGAPVYTDELTGLGLANGTDATNDINIGVGAAASDDATITSRVLMTVTSVLTKQLDATWAAGNNAGGRVSGQTLADGTWHVFLFRRSGGQDDVCFSNTLSFTLPDSGTKRRRIGSIVRASAAILGFKQEGDEFRWNLSSGALDFDASSGTAANTITHTVPIGIVVLAFGGMATSATAAVHVSSLDTPDVTPSTTAWPLYNAGVGSGTPANDGCAWTVRTNASGQSRWRSTVSVTLKVATYGWLDRRGRG
jgi:hypothetical protein